ncbi:MAG: serine/threonine protein kinase [Betaproteobacteria bacterium]|nr:serine/threonine protein kinase [Betaproteobacteria bacterium]
MTATTPPYARLTPDTILDAIDSLGFHCDGHLLALNSYENRVYQVGIDDQPPLVAKFYRPARWQDEQIQEEHDFVWQLVEREIPVVAPLRIAGETLHHYQGYRLAVFPRRGGRAPDWDRPNVLEWMGRFLGRIHAVGAISAYQHRPRLDIERFGIEPRDWLLTHDFIPADLREAWVSVIDQALEEVAACYQRAGEVAMIRLHGDCHSGNVLYTDAGPHFVDFDDSRMGPAIQDLWMLLSGSRGDMAAQLRRVLMGYEDFYEFDDRELHLIEALRTLRLIHYAAWLAQRWDDPAFPVAFPFFNSHRYWQDRILELREQVAAMQEGPLALIG